MKEIISGQWALHELELNIMDIYTAIHFAICEEYQLKRGTNSFCSGQWALIWIHMTKELSGT